MKIDGNLKAHKNATQYEWRFFILIFKNCDYLDEIQGNDVANEFAMMYFTAFKMM